MPLKKISPNALVVALLGIVLGAILAVRYDSVLTFVGFLVIALIAAAGVNYLKKRGEGPSERK